MEKVKALFRGVELQTILWVALAFGLTSAVYLSWLDRLVSLVGTTASDGLSLVAGYLLQAAGLFVSCAFFRRRRFPADGTRERRPAEDDARLRVAFVGTVALFSAVAVPALLTDSPVAVILFGGLMNLLCGVIAGFYLWVIGAMADARRKSMAFGGGYALATIGVGLLAIGRLTRGRAALPVCLALAGALIWASLRFDRPGPGRSQASDRSSQEERPGQEAPSKARDGRKTALLPLACVAIGLISVVKSLGFNFPSADIQAGLVPEIARIPYALGLLAAGCINDRNRKDGLICTVVALIIPFLMLGLIHEPISSAVFWGLNYIFYAFFSVFRVTIILDIIEPEDGEDASDRWLAPLGLLIGRIGDAAGAGIGLVLAGHQVALIAATVALFIPSVFVLYRLYEGCFVPKAAPQRDEKAVFDLFCMHNDLSSREREVFQMLLAGQTNGQIGEALFISENTVKFHVKNILQKTGCKNRGELQGKYMQVLYHTGATPLAPFE